MKKGDEKKGDEVEVIDETAAFYRKHGWLVDMTTLGKLIVLVNGVRLIEVDAHQVDISDLTLVNSTASFRAPFDWLSEA
jgi:hypothetical protein